MTDPCPPAGQVAATFPPTWDPLLTDVLSDPRELVLIVNVDGAVRFANPLVRDLGAGRPLSSAGSYLSLVHPADLPAIKQAVQGWTTDDPGNARRVTARLRLTGADGWRSFSLTGRRLSASDRDGDLLIRARDVTQQEDRLAALETAVARWRALDELSREVSVVAGPDLSIRYVSRSLQRELGHSPEEVQGRDGASFVHPGDIDLVRDALRRVLSTPGVLGPVEARLRAADGRWVWAEGLASAALDDPAIGGIILIIRMIDEHVRTRETLKEREESLRRVLDTLHEGIWQLDAEHRAVLVNQHLADLLGFDAEEMMGRPIAELLGEEQAGELTRRILRRAPGEVETYETQLVTGTGQQSWRLVNGVALFDETGTFSGSLGSSVDITERKRLEQRLERLSLYDELTGLPNRTLFTDRLAQLAASDPGAVHSIISIDIDHMALLNDGAGRESGDLVLQTIAARIVETVGSRHTVARVDGDQFAVLCPGMAEDAAGDLAATVSTVVGAPLQVPTGHTFHLTVSIGVASTALVDVDDLPAAADAAMLTAKLAGRGGLSLASRSRLRRSSTDLRIMTDLHAALADDALALHYQPILDLEEGGCVGVEALLRWPDAAVPLAPGDLVEIAHRANLLHELGRWTLRRACRDAATWPPGPHGRLQLSVNLSPRQFAAPDLHQVVTDALQASGIAPHRLTLEITETSTIDDGLGSVLGPLRAQGVRISLDDFGTGYATLAHVRRLPLDEVKIDRSFIEHLDVDQADATIVASLAGLAAGLQLQVVAEGVETVGQASRLGALGCRLAQGFLWSPAVPSSAVPALVARLRPRTSKYQRSTSPPALPPPLVGRMLALHQSGASDDSIAAALNAEGHLTPRETHWRRSSVAQYLDRLLPGRRRS